MLVVERVTGFGDTCWWSMRSRAGEETCAICIGPVPLGQPVAGGVGVAVTTAVGTDVADVAPAEFFAVTLTRSVLPASTDFSAYVWPLAPLMPEQLPPILLQRRHW